MNYRAAAQYLSSFINHEKNLRVGSFRRFHLERVRIVLEAIGSPEKHLKTIHIAGSKGKGSTAALTASILRSAGYRVGLYTSPHLYDLRERIRILDPKAKRGSSSELFFDAIPKDHFAGLVAKLKPYLEESHRNKRYGSLTYFEVLTILALYYFRQQNVDFAVLETGLGGRLDATNVCEPWVCAITPIGLEHTAILGKTLDKITREKAGIIKKIPGFPPPRVVVGAQSPLVRKILQRHCEQIKSSILWVGRDLQTAFLTADQKQQKFVMSCGDHKLTVSTRLLGAHQRDNAATAYGIARSLFQLGFSISDQSIKDGLAQVEWPLRFEILDRHPVQVVDGAHTPESCLKLAETIQKNFFGRKIILVFGVSADKDVYNLARPFLKIADQFILTQAQHARALKWDKKHLRFFKTQVRIVENVPIACKLAIKMCRGDQIIVAAGSIFLAAEARKEFLKI